MNSCKGIGTISFGLLAIILSACVAANGGQRVKPTLDATVLGSGQQCLPAPETWAATWITSPEELHRFILRCTANRIGAASTLVPAVDFDRFGVLAVEMGSRPTAGYGFDSGHVTAVVEDHTAVIGLTYRQPAPGALTAQVMTSPWILIRLPDQPFGTIRVMDQQNRLLAQLAIHP